MDMDNISDILSSLSDKDIENLKDVAQSVFGSSENESKENQNSFGAMPDLSSINPEIIGKVTRIMSSMNKHDPRCDLISALKPLLSKGKQHKADEAIQMLRLFELIPMIKDMQQQR